MIIIEIQKQLNLPYQENFVFIRKIEPQNVFLIEFSLPAEFPGMLHSTHLWKIIHKLENNLGVLIPYQQIMIQKVSFFL